ncbi:MAG: hypothetical protein NTV86_18665 [Planctomycetota bacterium]|nr:hypothetical protein [Planctomycetota bacterium]
MIAYKCAHCGTRLESPESMAGQSERCFQCGQKMVVPARPAAGQVDDNPYRALETTPVRPAAKPSTPVPNPAVSPSAEESAVDALNAGGEPRPLRRPIIKTAPQSGFFSPEKRGIEKGVLGGLLMMVIAVVWFVLGWKAGRIFFYPPILFVIGLFGFLKGLVTGNFAGNKKANS